MILLCISVFGFVELTAALKFVSLKPYGRNCFLLKIANARIFSTVNRSLKFLSAAGRKPKFRHSCKLQTVQMTTNEQTLLKYPFNIFLFP